MGIYSHSKLSCFEQCRYLYKLKYIDKVEIEIPTTIEAFMGALVHRVLEKLYRDLMYQKLNSKEELINYYNMLWDKEWTDSILIVNKNYTQNNYRAMGERYISDYYSTYFPFDQSKTIALETKSVIRLNNKHSYHVRIDRLSEQKKGVYEIRDYKTNSRLPPQAVLDEDRQLAMYSIWVKNTFKDARQVKLIWHFLAFNKEMVSERTDEELAELKNQVLELIDKIESCTSFPTNVSTLCKWCIYRQICPEFRHEYELQQKNVEDFKKDSGVVLVDKFSELKAKEAELKKDLLLLRERLIEFASQKNLNRIYGSNTAVSIKKDKRLKFLPKNKRAALERFIKQNGLWEKYSTLDTSLLSKDIISGRISDKILWGVKSFYKEEDSIVVRIIKKADDES